VALPSVHKQHLFGSVAPFVKPDRSAVEVKIRLPRGSEKSKMVPFQRAPAWLAKKPETCFSTLPGRNPGKRVEVNAHELIYESFHKGKIKIPIGISFGKIF
jgi:hypothetical protein